MHSIPRFSHTAPSKQQTSTAIKEALSTDLPSDLTNIISDYVHEDIDYHLLRDVLEFDMHGAVTNPEVRAAYKAVLKSPFFTAAFKSQLIFHPESRYHPAIGSLIIALYRGEIRTISEEIFAAGDRIDMSDMEISNTRLTLYLRGANLRGATIRDTEIGSDMSYADLTGAKFINVRFRFARMNHAVTTGMEMIGCNFRSTEVTGTLLIDPKLLKLVFKGSDKCVQEDYDEPYLDFDSLKESNLFLLGDQSDASNSDSVESNVDVHFAGRCMSSSSKRPGSFPFTKK